MKNISFSFYHSTAAILFTIFLSGIVQAEKLTVAFFDFETKERSLEKNGQLVRDLAEALLSVEDNLRVVTRSDMAKILEENKIGLAGLTEESAPQVGKLIGAQVMIVGRLFLVNERLFITARVISVETSRAFAVVSKGDYSDLDLLAEQLTEQIKNTINDNYDQFLAPKVTEEDQLKKLKEKLGDGDLPGIFVYLPEKHISQPTIDPAAQTEVEAILNKSGFELFLDNKKVLNKWARGYLSKSSTKAPEVDEVDVVLIGEAFSEYATRTGELITCNARVEIKAVDLATGKILSVDSETFRATDLSEHIAAKNALQQAAANLTYRILPEIIKKWRHSNN